MNYRDVATMLLDIRSDDGTELSCRCPLGHTDNRPSFRFNVNNGLWVCHSCNAAGNAYTLYKELTDDELILDDIIEYRSILGRLNENLEPKYNSFEEACDNAYMYQCGNHYKYWNDRGINDRQIINKFGLGYDQFENALTLPTEYGIVRRFLEFSDAKYKFPRGMLKSAMLYGYDFINNPVVAVCEGQIDALSCWQSGINAVAIFGSSVSSKQVEMLRALDAQFLVLFLDDDEKGWEGSEKIKSKLGKSFSISEVDYTGYEGLDPASIPSGTIKNLVSEAVSG